jgi:hypothetical protein
MHKQKTLPKMYVSETLCLFVVLYSVTPEDEQNPDAIPNLYSSPIVITKEQTKKDEMSGTCSTEKCLRNFCQAISGEITWETQT